MTPQKLKNSILQLAIQGKLVEQRSDEGTAEELYQQIQAEKQKLIKEGKIKKEKPLPEITEEEKPFDIPDSWKWVRLINISSVITDGTHQTPHYVDSGVPFVSVKDISHGFLDFSSVKYITQDEHEKLVEHCKPELGDILVCRIGTLGKALTINTAEAFSIFVSLGLIKLIDKRVAKYIETTINSGYGYSWIQQVKVGGGTHTFKINLEDLRLLWIPLPPLAEQRRIVSKIEELLPLIDRYEKAWARLEEFNKSFPGDMQKSLLQMAIQGKLVEQRPEEGTAEVLYQQIQAEKQKLIKEGKIKKEKPLPEIMEEEKPFDIPDSWKWCRFGTIVSMQPGFAFKSDDFKGEGSYKLLRGINLGVDCVRWDDTVYLDHASEQQKEYLIHNGDVLLGLDRPWISDGIRVAIFCEQDQALLVQRVLRIRETSAITNKYATLMLRSVWFKNSIESQTTGISVPHISPGQVANFLIPLPPLAEQKRIVARLEELLPLCDKLK